MSAVAGILPGLLQAWKAAWEPSLASWSRFVKLLPPRWCLTEEEERREELSGSFAMIRLSDHAVVISLRQVALLGLGAFAVQVLAHEIGHHVYAPADLADNGRLLARVRAGLPGREGLAPTVANLYTDLLINDRLERSAGLDMAAVYRALRPGTAGAVSSLYLGIYEKLWALQPGALAPETGDPRILLDAELGARLVRAYSRDWLRGAGRFAMLFLEHLPQPGKEAALLSPWLDTERAGAGEEIPDGLAELDDEEAEGAIHPADDEALSGVGGEGRDRGTGRSRGAGGAKRAYRSPREYAELLESMGVTVSAEERTIRYYRELAAPYLIRLPVREITRSGDPLPEGLECWDPGSSLEELDWAESAVRSPVVIPGVTTLKRSWGESSGSSAGRSPPDLYIGIDCSGSMTNPQIGLSYPVLAGAVVGLSALRAGVAVMACLSGEPGSHTETAGFLRDEHEVLRILTGYLGTGYAFGIGRLDDAFPAPAARAARPAHIFVVSDQDIFAMLGKEDGWGIAARAIERAGAGGTFVLETNPESYRAPIESLRRIGWDVHTVRDREELLHFARAFSKVTYGKRR